FVGELMGLRPVIQIKKGVSTTDAKVRGDKAVIPKIVEITANRIIPQTPYGLVYADNDEQVKELAAALTKKLGYPPEMQFRIGGVIAANAGPDLVGAFFKGKD
ncbi:MAG: DegV family protein, partial [Oscillospiraceae bacterium]|nr:DegV family protein [Oscillospiraceae bacterium]